nr:hypothetical protein Iba_chr10eCG9110 [Ipomoea batatas]
MKESWENGSDDLSIIHCGCAKYNNWFSTKSIRHPPPENRCQCPSKHECRSFTTCILADIFFCLRNLEIPYHEINEREEASY